MGQENLHKASQEYRFLLPWALYYEASSDSDPDWPLDKWKNLLRKCDCVCRQDYSFLALWEIEHGGSASNLPKFPFDPESSDWIAPADRSGILDSWYAKIVRRPLSAHAKKQAKCFANKSEIGFFSELRDYLRTVPISRRCEQSLSPSAKSRNICIHQQFHPQPGWYSWGLALVIHAWLLFKEWKWGPEQKCPTNDARAASAWLDFEYLPYLVEADGLVTNDKTLLQLAKACWPDKANCIFTTKELLASLEQTD